MAINPSTLKLTKQHNFRSILFSVARSETGRLFTGGSDFKVCEFDPDATKPELKEIGKHESYVTSVVLADKALISGGYDGKLIWWDVEKKSQIRAIDAHKKWIRNIAVSPDGKTIASVADDMVCKVYEAATGKLKFELKGHKEKTPNHFPSMLYAVTFSSDGKYLATGDKVGHVVIWDAAKGTEFKTVESPGMYTWDGKQRLHSIGGIRSLVFSPDGKLLAVGGTGKIGNVDHLEANGRVEVFDWQAGKRSHLWEKLKGKGLVNRLWSHPKDGWTLGAGGAGNGFFAFLDLKANKILREENVKFHVHSFAMNAEGSKIYAVGHNSLAVYEMKA